MCLRILVLWALWPQAGDYSLFNFIRNTRRLGWMISRQPSDHSILWCCVLWPLSSLGGTSIIFFITTVFVHINNHFLLLLLSLPDWLEHTIMVRTATRHGLSSHSWNRNSVGAGVHAGVCAQSCLTLRDPMVCDLPGSSLYGVLQARILGCVVISFSRGSSWPRDWTHVSCISCIGRRVLYHLSHVGAMWGWSDGH